jgi:imidazolonepropionase-like amidohydrolase
VPASAQESGGSVLIRNARVFDGEQVIGVRDVLVRDGRIASMAADIAAPQGTEVVDGTGKTLLPGLMDAHVHVFPTAAEDALRFGVTTEFDMFTLSEPATTAARRAQRISFGRTDKADVWSAGLGVTLAGAHPTGLAKNMGVDLPTLPDDGDAAAFVIKQVEQGSDYIKLFQDSSPREGKPRFPEYSHRQLRAIVDASHEAGRKVIVHVSQEKDASAVFALGADALAHMFDDKPAGPDVVRLARKRRATIIATLSVLAGASGDPTSQTLTSDPAIKRFLSPAQTGMIAQTFPRPRPAVLTNALESVRRFHAAGVRVLAGTDAPNPTTAHGPSIHAELELLVRAGMTPAQALAAATSHVADFFGTSDRGRIAPGKRADLLLVDGDPVRDVTATRRISVIWKNGYPVDRAGMPGMPSTPGAKP